MAVDADRDEADDCERQQVVADEKRDEDVACCCDGNRHTGVPCIRAYQCGMIRRQYRSVHDSHTDPDPANRQQDITSSSQPVQTRSTAVAETADRTEYDALINHHLDNNSLPCS